MYSDIAACMGLLSPRFAAVDAGADGKATPAVWKANARDAWRMDSHRLARMMPPVCAARMKDAVGARRIYRAGARDMGVGVPSGGALSIGSIRWTWPPAPRAHVGLPA
ncbi:hypothetical protein PF008_g17974 [Phytophthora fragariae]|uniref:Uncharacterized protein n=1 Tax=Phytophthora fragariae TaxID=53985 RepID=A0A6G0R736_9STRA|nr:hypothetical protein PF008_g17974 [Phytophthora fragariae]